MHSSVGRLAVHVLDHRQRRVAEDVGEHDRVHATVERRRGIGVPKRVRIDALADAGSDAQVLNELLNSRRGEWSVVAPGRRRRLMKMRSDGTSWGRPRSA